MPAPAAMPATWSDLSVEELAAWMKTRGFSAAHAPRLVRELMGAPVDASMRWPESLHEQLQASFSKPAAALVQRQVSADSTTKLLLRLHDGRTIESVLMPDYREDRASGCISSQAGCAMGCDFCATTQTGFERNLTSGEIIEQFLHLKL